MLKFEVGTPIHLSHKKPALGFIGVKPKKNPKVTVQVTAYNERDDLLKCLGSIFDQTFKDFEVVLIDNGLDKDIVEQAKKHDLIYIDSGSNLGCCGGRNLGATHASGELITFIDADGYIEKDFLENAVRVMDDKDVVAARGKVLPFQVSNALPGHYNLGDKPGVRLIDTEGCSIWRTEDYRKVGGFEDSLAGGEGLVLCYRMVKMYGYSKDAFRYDPSFVLYHDFHSTKSHLEKKLYKQTVTRDALLKKYPDIAELERYYAKNGPKPIIGREFKISAAAHRAKKKVDSEYAALYEQKRTERLNNPELVKNSSSYDFSVVIPCFNLGELLVDAVDSVLRQSIESVQIIVVDDVSTDPSTIKVLKGLEKSVTVVYAEENGGVAKARNIGVELAKADYVLCLDADDTIEPTYLEKAKSFFEMNDKVGIVSCWAKYFGGANSTWKPQAPITLERTLVGSPIPTASCFRKSAWKQVGGYEPRIRGYEDWEFWINLIKNGWLVEIVPEALFNYFVRPGSKVNTSNKNADKILGVFFDKHREAFVDNLEYVIVEKHREIVRLRVENRELRNQKLRVALGKTKPGKAYKMARSVARLSKKHLGEIKQEYAETKSTKVALRSLKTKSSLFTRKAKRTLLKNS